VGRIPPISQDSDARNSRDHFLREFKPLARQSNGEIRNARYVAARPCQACDESPTDWIARPGHDNGNTARRLLGRGHDGIPDCQDHIDAQPDQLSQKFGNPVELAIGRPVFDDEILTLHVAEFAQTVARGLPQVAF
jgi:hypothetical protein